jgi:hypothetical protein
MMEQDKLSGTLSLEKALPVLAKSGEVSKQLVREVGKQKATLMLEMMASGKLSGELGAEGHDYFVDAIMNESESVWSGMTSGSEGSAVDVSIFMVCITFTVTTLLVPSATFWMSSELSIVSIPIGRSLKKGMKMRTITTKATRKTRKKTTKMP